MIVQDYWTILQISDEVMQEREKRRLWIQHTAGQSEREAQKAQANREELVERLTQALPDDGTAEPLEGLLLSRASAPTELGYSVFFPAFCVIAQGRKEMLLGDNRYWYDPAHYLIATAELPIASQITEASPERPYLGLILTLDPRLVGSVMVEAGHGAPHSQSARDGHRREPAGRGSAGRGGAAGHGCWTRRATHASWRRWSRGRSSTGC